jgi:hypothetical protein
LSGVIGKFVDENGNEVVGFDWSMEERWLKEGKLLPAMDWFDEDLKNRYFEAQRRERGDNVIRPAVWNRP